MKYFTLHASIAVATVSILAGCGGDVTRTRDIYRNEYKYKPVQQKEEEPALPPTPAGGAAPAPVTPAAPAPAPAAPAPAAPEAAAPAGDGADSAPAQ